MTNVLGANLHVGDVIHEHDWRLVVAVVDPLAPGVVVVEQFPGTLLHYPPAAVLDVDVAQVTLP